MLTRRAYLFMAMRLISRIFGGWNGLRLSRAALLSFEPKAAARLLLLRMRHHLWQWHAAAAARTADEHYALECALTIQRAGARTVLRSLAALATRRRRRRSAVSVAVEGVRMARIRRQWGGWSRAFAVRVAMREGARSQARPPPSPRPSLSQTSPQMSRMCVLPSGSCCAAVALLMRLTARWRTDVPPRTRQSTSHLALPRARGVGGR
jgi:hypothetical protein